MLQFNAIWLYLVICLTNKLGSAYDSDIEKVVGIRRLLCHPSSNSNSTDDVIDIERLIPVLVPEYVTGTCCTECSYDTSKCFLLGTCCPDLMDHLPTVEESVKERKSTCDYPQYISHDIATPRPTNVFAALVVRKCPDDYAGDNQQSHAEIKDKCENMSVDSLEDVVPVLDTSINITYANIYCSRCYNVNPSNLVYWQPYVVCKNLGDNVELTGMTSNNLLTKVKESKMCNIFYDLHSSLYPAIESCQITRNTCNITGFWEQYDPFIEKACYAYRSEFLDTSKSYTIRYRNVFCALCNERRIDGMCKDFESQAILPSFSALLSFNAAAVEKNGHEDEKTARCNDDQIFDPYKNKCRVLSCWFPKTFEEGECRNVVEHIRGMAYRMFIKVTPDTFIRPETFKTKSIFLLLNKYIRSQLEKWNIYSCVYTFKMFYKEFIFDPDNDTSTVEMTTARDITPIELPDGGFIIPPPPFISNSGSTNSQSYQVSYLIYKIEFFLNPRLAYLNTSVLDDILDIDDTIDNINQSIDAFTEFNLSFRLNLEDFGPYDRDSSLVNYNDNTILVEASSSFQPALPNRNIGGLEISPNLAVTLTERNKCTLVELNENEYDIATYLNGILINDVNVSVDRKFFHTIQNGNNSVKYNLCSNVFLSRLEKMNISQVSNYHEQATPSLAKGIMSLVCMALSIICNILTFVAYARFKELRTQPGVNNMVLVLLLTIAQCMFQVGLMNIKHYSSAVCMTVGILIHFFWLAVIFWMGVCSFHMFKVFNNINLMHSQHFSLTTTSIYFTISFFSALVFILSNIISSIIYGESDYGYSKVTCYISKQSSIGYTFALPVGIVILANISFFVVVIFQMKRNTSDIILKSSTSRNYSKIYTKLSTITGMTWVFGFLFSFTNNVIFEYIFIILNSLQGVFIFLAFICNKRVSRLLKGKQETSIPDISSNHKTNINKTYDTNKTGITEQTPSDFKDFTHRETE